MSAIEPSTTADAYDYEGNAALFDGLLSRRVLAFLLDFTAIGLIVGSMTFMLFLAGFLTFGLLWLALPVIVPPIAVLIILLYVAFTAGSEQAATPGMRLLGIQLRMVDGRKPYPLIAVFHTICFYFLSTVLTPFIVLVGLITPRKRLLHDFICGLIVINIATKNPRNMR